MIVPLQVRIERVERPESFDVDERPPELRSLVDPPVYRLLAVVLDTEAGQVRTYDLHTLVDNSRAMGEEVGMITFSSVEENRQFLTELRDALDGVLS